MSRRDRESSAGRAARGARRDLRRPPPAPGVEGRDPRPASRKRDGGDRGRLRAPHEVVAVAAGLAVIVAAWWFVGRDGDRATPTAPATDPAAGLDPRAAFARALDLGTKGRHTASIPYFRRALDGNPVPPWLLHRNLAAALQNSTLEVRTVGALAAPVTRASIERVAQIREALEEYDTAERLAPSPAVRAQIAVLRGQLLSFWGLPWDALAEFERAVALAPDFSPARQAAENCRRELGVK